MQQLMTTAEWVHQFVEPVIMALEIGGVAVVAVGTLVATGQYFWSLRCGEEQAYERFRANLGRAILLALELLVGADILATVTAPLSFESVGLLGLVVLIRTFLSFSLETEIEGVAPWRRRAVENETDRAR